MINSIPYDLVSSKDPEDAAYKLAHLILNDVIFCNNGWWLENGADKVTHHVGCNDVFGWGCADSEDITYSEIDDLYDMWLKDENWGPAVWCIKKRQAMPQKPVEKLIREKGIWDLDTILIKKDKA